MQREKQDLCPRKVLLDKNRAQCDPYHEPCALYRLQDLLLELALDLLTRIVRTRLAVKSHERTEIKLRRLQEFDLANVNLVPVSVLQPQFYCDPNPHFARDRCPG